jgi:hypothetical protein
LNSIFEDEDGRRGTVPALLAPAGGGRASGTAFSLAPAKTRSAAQNASNTATQIRVILTKHAFSAADTNPGGEVNGLEYDAIP